MFSFAHFIVCINVTINNTFVTLIDRHGKVLFSCSGGLLDFKGPRRASATCSFKVGAEISKKLTVLSTAKNKGTRINISIQCPFTRKVRSVISGLGHYFNNYHRIVSNYNKAHNGVRLRKPRRT